MKKRQGKTWLCSVVFLDIAAYTEHSVASQVALKKRLDALIDESVSEVPKSNLIIVDTGDGAALCFLGDPEEALFSAVDFRDALMEENKETDSLFEVRIGINLGPIKVVKNLNGQLNPLGDGINKAQRIMSFAKPNQILVSRSFYDVIACLSQEYAQLFHYLGMRKDKHIREYPIYEVLIPGQVGDPSATKLIIETLHEVSEKADAAPTAFSPSELEAAVDAYAGYVGPLAKVLVKRHARNASSLDNLYQLLADSIPTESLREDFLARMIRTPTSKMSDMQDTIDRNADPVEPETVTGPETTGASTPASTWDPVVLKQAEAHLATYLGPMAVMLVKKAARTTSNAEELYRQLALELPTPEQQKAFLAMALGK